MLGGIFSSFAATITVCPTSDPAYQTARENPLLTFEAISKDFFNGPNLNVFLNGSVPTSCYFDWSPGQRDFSISVSKDKIQFDFGDMSLTKEFEGSIKITGLWLLIVTTSDFVAEATVGTLNSSPIGPATAWGQLGIYELLHISDFSSMNTTLSGFVTKNDPLTSNAFYRFKVITDHQSILMPTPEPGPTALLVTGVLVLLGRRKNRQL